MTKNVGGKFTEDICCEAERQRLSSLITQGIAHSVIMSHDTDVTGDSRQR